MSVKVCCICGKYIEGWGNNPDPLPYKATARCCDACNDMYVIPARIKQILHEKSTKVQTDKEVKQ